MTNQVKNPIFWCLVAVLVGILLLIWGGYRHEATGNYKGSGAMLWAGGILLSGGLLGWQIFGKRKG